MEPAHWSLCERKGHDHATEMYKVAIEGDETVLASTLTETLTSHKICTLKWDCMKKPDAAANASNIPDFPNLPNLTALHVDFRYHYSFDFVSGVLERHPKITEVRMQGYRDGNAKRFFGALEHVTSLHVQSGCPKFRDALSSHVSKDHLTCLGVETYRTDGRLDPRLKMWLGECSNMTTLYLGGAVFAGTMKFPKSLTTLHLYSCRFDGDVRWKSLSNLRALNFGTVEGLDWAALGRALTSLVTLRLFYFGHTTELLTSLNLDQLQSLSMCCYATAHPELIVIKRIVGALQRGPLKHLELPCHGYSEHNVKKHILPALARSNLTSLKLGEWKFGGNEECKFHRRMALLTLLLARRPQGVLRKLPVEMFRLVGQMLI